MDELTKRQQEILRMIREFIADSGFPPTRADICRAMGFSSPNAAEEHLRTLERKGAIEMLAGASRGIRLIAESGLPGFDVAPWWGLFLPARTAPAIVAKLHDDTIAVLAESESQKRMRDLGSILVGSTPDELARYLQAEMARWGPVIRDANIRLDG